MILGSPVEKDLDLQKVGLNGVSNVLTHMLANVGCKLYLVKLDLSQIFRPCSCNLIHAFPLK
jgi:hypothetical protein